MNLSIEQCKALKTAALSAVLVEDRTKLPARLTVSQWALESGWGAHEPGNNCFGIKAYEGCHGTRSIETREFIDGKFETVTLEFATFPDINACFNKRADLITQSKEYSFAWEKFLVSKDSEQLIRDYAHIYATDPLYAAHVITLMRETVVLSAVEIARRTIQGWTKAPTNKPSPNEVLQGT